MLRVEEYIEITVEFKLGSLKRIGTGQYLIKWIDGKDKIITMETMSYAVQTQLEALHSISMIMTLNPEVKSVTLRRK